LIGPEMTLDDLLQSLDKTASVLDEAGWWEWAKTLREHRELVERASTEKNERNLSRCVNEIKDFFGGMGSLNDIGGPIRGKMADKEEKSAESLIEDQLDDLFLQCLFWKTERQEALSRKERMTKALHRVFASVDRSFVRANPAWVKEHPDSIDQTVRLMRPRVYYHIKPSWYRKWSD
jgi:hypothetical protein